jgi:transcriptional regulator with XRE-family HTH domain
MKEVTLTATSRQVSTRLSRLRKARGWSQRDLAEKLAEHGYQMAQSNVTRMENGERKTFSVDLVVLLADIFGISLDELVNQHCSTCEGSPPAGFKCQSCGAEAT